MPTAHPRTWRSARRNASLALCLLLIFGAAQAQAETGREAQREGRAFRVLKRGSRATLGAARWGAAWIGKLAARQSRALALSLRGFGVAGAGGLVVTGVHGLAKARGATDALDAGSDLAWGLRGLASYAAVDRASMGWLRGAQGFGAVGGLCQIGAGACRIRLGMQRRDRSLVTVGALDVAGGLFTLGWDLLGFSNPWLLGAYATTMVAREIYANRKQIAAVSRRAGQKLRCVYGRCRVRVATSLRSFARGLERVTRRRSRVRSAGLPGGSRRAATDACVAPRSRLPGSR
jgi:hypothetical protein